MADIRLAYDESTQEFDIDISNGDLALDYSLETAVIISLFTDAYADQDSDLPQGETDRRGWWADDTLPNKDKIGSLLWTGARRALTEESLRQDEEAAKSALKWMLDDGVAKEVNVSAVRTGLESKDLSIEIIKPDKAEITKYKSIWDATNVIHKTFAY